MKKGITLALIGTALLILISVIFWRNMLGFYHEVIRQDVVDLGGYGIEDVHDLMFDDAGNLYVLSLSQKEVKDENGHYSFSSKILISKIDENKKVEWSFPITEINDEDLRYETTLTLSEFNHGSDDALYFLVKSDSRENIRSTDYLIRVNEEDKEFKATDVTKEDYNAKNLFYYENKLYLSYEYKYSIRDSNILTYSIRDSANLEKVSNKVVTINAYNKLEELIIKDDHMYLLTSLVDQTKDNKLYSFRLHKISLNDDTYELLDTNLVTGSHHFVAMNESRIIYTTVDSLWSVEELTIHGYDFNDDKVLRNQIIQLHDIDNRIYGIHLDHRNHIFVYGTKESTSFVDSYYEEYGPDSKMRSEYKASIGGVDSIRHLKTNQSGQLVLVISSSRIKDMDYIEMGGVIDNDQMIRYREIEE